jgi:hypothetical protein
MQEKQEEKLIKCLDEIGEQLYEINKNLNKIAKFFEKWKDFDGGRPDIYVSADVATHED